MLTLLTKILPSSWLIYLLASVALVAGGAWTGSTLQKGIDASAISSAQHSTAIVQQQFDAYKIQVSSDTARANSEAFAMIQQANQKIVDLSKQLQLQRQANQHQSTQLTSLLNEKTSVTLSPSVLNYLSMLRNEQLSNDTSRTSP